MKDWTALMDADCYRILSYRLIDHRIIFMNEEALRIYGFKNLAEAQDQLSVVMKRASYSDTSVIESLHQIQDKDGTIDYECVITTNDGLVTNAQIRTESLVNSDGERIIVTNFIDTAKKKLLNLDQQRSLLEKTYIAAAQKNEVIEALAELYSGILSLNLITRKYRIIEDNYNLEAYVSPDGRWASLRKVMTDIYVSPEHRGQFLRFADVTTLAERMKNRKILSLDLKTTDGKWYTLTFIAKRYDIKGNVISVLLTATDIDEVKRQEIETNEALNNAVREAKLANDAKTNFLRRMSHDIRTPLNGIIGMINISERYYDNKDELYRCKDKIMNSLDYLQTLLNNVLDVSKVETGTLVLDNKPFDIINMLVKLVSVVETAASEYGVTVGGGNEMSSYIHRHLIGSEMYLYRILMNLAGNAVKYNRKGGMVRLYSREISSDGDTAVYEFVCADTGIGMSEEFQKHAFEPYVREGKETVTSFSGTGLGLSIVKEIVDLMDGTIELESTEGVGTTFTVTIPFKIDHNASTEYTDEEIKLDLTGRRALLVEDNDINLEISQLLLEDEGLEIITAKNGKEAVETFSDSAEGSFDYIFMDLMMPVMDGLEATRSIRALDRPDAKSVPIIAMTANAFQEDVRHCLDAGMDAHLAKPVDVRKIREILHRL